MTSRKGAAKKPDGSSKPGTEPKAKPPSGEADLKLAAKILLSPSTRHGQSFSQLLKANLEGTSGAPGAGHYADAFYERASKVADGDLRFASHLLAAQASTLDGVFTEMVRRMALNMGDYLGATETYARIALKAQAGARATLAELVKLHQPREQTVRHVHVNEGGQAVIADQFHNHGGVKENGQSSGQPHATGAFDSRVGPALPSPDPLGPAVPVSSRERKEAVPNARRQGKRST